MQKEKRRFKILKRRFLLDKNIITIEADKRSGKPCIRGTRIAVAAVFDYLGGGMTIAEILDDFPDFTAEDIRACFAFAADRERLLSVIPYEAVV